MPSTARGDRGRRSPNLDTQARSTSGILSAEPVGAPDRPLRLPSVDAERRRRARSLLPVAAVTILAAALRFPTLGDQSYWLDEAITVDLLRHDFVDMLRALPGAGKQPSQDALSLSSLTFDALNQ